MKAVVMAGGQGSRLRPLTSNQPKPMLPIVGEPMMQHILRLLRAHGFTDVVVTVQFLASVVRNYFGDGSDQDLSLAYATEEFPLGTAGSVKNAQDLLDEPFLVISGDALTDIDLGEVVRLHRDRGAAVTVALKRVEDPLEFGIVITGSDGRIERFLEKPGWGEVFSDQINTGIYVVEPEVLDFVPEGEEFDFSKDLFPLLLDKGLPLYGAAVEGAWTDVGTLEAYQAAHRDVLDGKVKVEVQGFRLEGDVWIGEEAEVDPEARIEGPVYIGPNVRVEGGADLREYTVLGSGVVVKSGAFLHRAIVQDHAYVGPSASLRGCVVGKNADVKHGARVEEGAVVGDECHVGEGAVLNPNVKVYPFKQVDPGALVTKSIIWETRGARSLFGERGASGLVNIDITPEMALRLAMAFATTLPKRSVVVASRDVTTTARIVKRAMVAGANAAGVHVHDLEVIPAPVARFYARSARANSGIAVRTTPGDPASVDVQLFDGRGIDIDPSVQRKVERNFNRDDLRRAFHHELGELTFPARGREYYTRQLLEVVDSQAIRGRRPKLVVDYGNAATTLTGPDVLGRLGAELLAANATLDEERLIHTEEEAALHLGRLGGLVGASGAQLGVLFDPVGERIDLVDDRGRVVSRDRALLAFLTLVARTMPDPRVAVPVTASRAVEAIVEEAGGSVLRTRISPAALMAAAEERDVVFAGAEGGGYIFPKFLAAYDGLMSVVELLELLAGTGTTLARVVDDLPEAHVARRDVAIPWEAKGTVMRRLLERSNGERTDTTDGLKTFHGEDWVLVAPHPQEPVIRIWAEAGSAEDAGSMAGDYASLIEELKA
ncbi:MAG: NTP transferase domain-containing protein [Actinobacteria bacterium]|nr:NTP transferase domain-containing protein [Actinomycetota bacterium]